MTQDREGYEWPISWWVHVLCDRSEYLIFARSLTIEGSFSQSMCQRNLVIWKHSFICSQWEKKSYVDYL